MYLHTTAFVFVKATRSLQNSEIMRKYQERCCVDILLLFFLEYYVVKDRTRAQTIIKTNFNEFAIENYCVDKIGT